MANTRGIFSLSDIQERVFFDTWLPRSDVWIAPSPYMAPAPNTGYFGGGIAPGGIFSTVDKINYTTNTILYAAPLSITRFSLAATGNSTNGYFGGGIFANPNSYYSTMEKINYSSDTPSVVPGASLSGPRYGFAAAGNTTAGYFGGGITPGFNGLSTMDKVTYSTDTTAAVPGARLSNGRYGLAATGNSTAGYFGGGAPGNVPSNYSTIDKITYSSDTTAVVPTALLSFARQALGATGNSTAGYFGGGGQPGAYSTVDKITYSSDTAAALSAPGCLRIAESGRGATGNSTNGYFGGGGSAPIYTSMDKITYSTDTTVTVPGASLSVARAYMGTTSAFANALPSAPFLNPAPSSPSVRYSDNYATPPNTGYFGGGTNSGNTSSSIMDKIDYTTDTRSTLAPLNFARGQGAAVSSSTAGYFGGGKAWGGSPGWVPYSTIQKITYSTDTIANTTSLTSTRENAGAAGSPTAGYFAGPPNGAAPFTPNKITYSSDTVSAIPALPTLRSIMGATGNTTAGYFGGGGPGPSPASFSTMDKVTYSSDTTAAVPAGPLSAATFYVAATGNSTAGYFGGGVNPSYTPISKVDRITYSTETTVQVPGAALKSPRSRHSATGNSASGYFGSGDTPSSQLMDKLIYTTETSSLVPSLVLPNGPQRVQPFATGARANALSVIEPPAATPTPGPFIV